MRPRVPLAHDRKRTEDGNQPTDTKAVDRRRGKADVEKIIMSRISIVDLEVFYQIGVTEEERAKPQRLLLISKWILTSPPPR